MSERPEIVDLVGAARVVVSTRMTRAAPWLGVAAAAIAGVAGLPWVAVGVAGLSVLATRSMRLLGARKFRRLRSDDVVEASIGESETKGTTLVLRDPRGMQARVRLGSAGTVRELLEKSGLARRRLSIVSEPEFARAIIAAPAFTALVVGVLAVIGSARRNDGGYDESYPEALFAGVLLLANIADAARSVFPSRRTVVIGTDGVRIGRLFLPARDIETAFKRVRWEIVIRTKDGREHVAPIGTSTDARSEWLIERIRAVARDADDDAETLARAGRDLEAWRRDVEGRVRAGYRDGALTPERLATVLDDPTAIPDRRLGAALALLAATPEPQRPAVRVRVAELAEAAADERLAKAFEELSRDALTPRTAARVREV